MEVRLKTMVRRRGLLRAMMAGAAVAAMNTIAHKPAVAEPRRSDDKRKARYQANSAEVQDFYRVNRYPVR